MPSRRVLYLLLCLLSLVCVSREKVGLRDREVTPSSFGIHFNVMAIGERSPGVQLPRVSDAATARMDQLNRFMHSLFGHGLWVDQNGLITALPGVRL
jgi:hypothetical protein